MNKQTFDFKAARSELKLTLAKAADITGIPASSIWSIEHGIHDSGAKRVLKLQKAYEDLLKGDE